MAKALKPHVKLLLGWDGVVWYRKATLKPRVKMLLTYRIARQLFGVG